jgi:hypothetical protein
MIRKVLIIVVVIFVIIQFIPSGRPDNNPVPGKDLLDMVDASDDVVAILKSACYDCHSQQVIYPWYSYVAPVSFLVSRDVREGREHLDFGLWGDLSKRKQIKALDEISEEVEAGEMPMKIYPIMHPDAKLTDAQRQQIIDWCEISADRLFE